MRPRNAVSVDVLFEVVLRQPVCSITVRCWFHTTKGEKCKGADRICIKEEEARQERRKQLVKGWYLVKVG